MRLKITHGHAIAIIGKIPTLKNNEYYNQRYIAVGEIKKMITNIIKSLKEPQLPILFLKKNHRID